MNRRSFFRACFGGAVVASIPVVAQVGFFQQIFDSNRHNKLKAYWSIECEHDLRSMHNIDAEVELTQILSEEINIEIDNEVLSKYIPQMGRKAA